MDWTQAKALLLDSLRVLLSDETRLSAWVASLDETPNDQLLGIAILSDLKRSSVPQRVMLGVLQHAIASAHGGALAFSSGLKQYASENPKLSLTALSSLPLTHLPASRRYVRVLCVETFTEHFAGPSFHYTATSPTHVKEVQEMFFSSASGTPLEGIEALWRGRLPIAWVTTLNELNDLLSIHPPDRHGTVTNDALGLNYDGDSTMVYVQYPPFFDQAVKCCAPTVLDLDWTVDPVLFVPNPAETKSWGRTFSCSGGPVALSERVHPAHKITPKYLGFPIGATDWLDIDEEALFAEACRRLDEILPNPCP